MRPTASILHLDLDAFFASVEQRDKPSLRGRPVIVGGTGGRGVVSTASYEARQFGVRSAMSGAEARARCPHAAFVSGRFDAYRHASDIVMQRLRQESPVIEPLSLDEAFIDLAAPDAGPFDLHRLPHRIEQLRADIADLTGGLTCSVGAGSSKLIAKIASELNKPDGHVIVAPGTELEVLAELPMRAIPGVGPATAERLRRVGITTVGHARDRDRDDLIAVLGMASGHAVYRLVRADDDRPVIVERATKSISSEDTFAVDLTDRARLAAETERLATTVGRRLRAAGLSGRTVTLKVRRHDFTTHTRSLTLAGPTDHAHVIAATARGLLEAEDLAGGIRLLGVGVSGLVDWVQDDLFDADQPEPTADHRSPDHPAVDPPAVGFDESTDSPKTQLEARHWSPGADIHHTHLGDGWVWGSGRGIVTVRFETRWTPPGPVRSFAVDDPALVPGHHDAPDTVGP